MVGLHFRPQRFLHTYSWRDETALGAPQHSASTNACRIAETRMAIAFERGVAIS
jgi:hypothetical protein